MFDVYLYGMILITNSFLLKGDFPTPDCYSELKAKYSLPGGETGTCATTLDSLGCTVKMDGTFMGVNTYEKVVDFYNNKKVDVSSLKYDKSFDGLEDYVLIDKNARTPFGTFATFFSDSVKRWNPPSEKDILESEVVGLDPFFFDMSEKAAQLCHTDNKPFVTIDCAYNSIIHKYSSINVISNEFISENYPQDNRESLFRKYADNTDGLVIFTLGSKSIMYGRKSKDIHYYTPFNIIPVSTLGAGDCFKAGCVYALLNNMSDEDTVMFASATAAVACMNFPVPLNPPTLDKINELILNR